MRTGLAMVTLLAVIAITGWASADDGAATLEDRVRSLEARLAALEQGGEGSDLRVRSLTVVDAQGTPRVRLGVDPGNCGLTVIDAVGRERIRLGAAGHGNVRLDLRARSGRNRLSVALLHGDAPYINLRSPTSELSLKAPHGGAVGLRIWGGPGKQNAQSYAGLSIWEDGTIAWGGGHRSAGYGGFGIKHRRDGVFDFVVRDHEERLLWEMPQHSPPEEGPLRAIRKALDSRTAEERRASVQALSAALKGDDPRLVRSALNLLRLNRTRRVLEYDREAMEGLVRRHLDNPDGRVRIAALWALLAVRGPSRGDVESALKVANTDDLTVLLGIGPPLFRHAQLTIAERAVHDVFLRLLKHERIEVVLAAAESVARAQARTSDTLNEALIGLWKKHRGRYRQFTQALAKVKPCTLPVVNALLEELSLPDVHGLHENEVIDALGHVETEETKAAVVARALQLLELGKAADVSEKLMRLIARYGTADDADRLERALETATLPEMVKRYGEFVLRGMRRWPK